MNRVFITGHRNPDMDSICSALGYAELKNLIDPGCEYIPVRCSHLGDGTKKLLASLEITPPKYMRDVLPKVEDVMLRPELKIDADALMTEYAGTYNAANPSAMPVFDGEKFFGLISVDDIASWTMRSLASDGKIENIPTVREVMGKAEDRLDVKTLFTEAKEMLSSSKRRGLAVFDGDEFKGYVSRRCFLNTPRYSVIMVDHNEPEQSIKGIETANIVEIIDHHRLNALKTDLPVFIDAEPLGSTCTIVYQLFLRNGIRPNAETARILLTGLIADTLILKSPTTTPTDKASAYALAAMCGVDVDEYGKKMFSNIEGLKNRDPEAAVSSDFKLYSEKNVRIGIGQCEVTTLQDLDEYKEEYFAALETVRSRNGLDWALVMITDVITEHSVLMSTPFSAEKHLQYASLEEHLFDMPDVMSRKKQLLPEILHAVAI